jgi:hypothetical protein
MAEILSLNLRVARFLDPEVPPGLLPSIPNYRPMLPQKQTSLNPRHTGKTRPSLSGTGLVSGFLLTTPKAAQYAAAITCARPTISAYIALSTF